MGRSVFSLLIMLVTFAVIGALFVMLDAASGVHVQLPAFSAASRATRTATPGPTRSLATASATATAPTAPTTAAAATPARGIAPSSTPTSPPQATTPAASVTPAATPTTSPTVLAATPTPTQTAGVTVTTGATPTGATTATVTATVTAMPSPPGGITPPIYGTAPNYINNTAFSPTFMEGLDKRIVTLTNAQRTAHGLAPLAESGTLDIIAASRSEDLVKRNYFDHYDPTSPLDAQGRHIAAIQELLARNGVGYAEVGENLIGYTGYSLDDGAPQQAVQAWMRHPEHRANILHAGYTTIGVGMAAQDQTDGLRVVITQVFLR